MRIRIRDLGSFWPWIRNGKNPDPQIKKLKHCAFLLTYIQYKAKMLKTYVELMWYCNCVGYRYTFCLAKSHQIAANMPLCLKHLISQKKPWQLSCPHSSFYPPTYELHPHLWSTRYIKCPAEFANNIFNQPSPTPYTSHPPSLNNL